MQSHILNAVSSVCVTFRFEQWPLVNFSGGTRLWLTKNVVAVK